MSSPALAAEVIDTSAGAAPRRPLTRALIQGHFSSAISFDEIRGADSTHTSLATKGQVLVEDATTAVFR
jgi:hypothetical protein